MEKETQNINNILTIHPQIKINIVTMYLQLNYTCQPYHRTQGSVHRLMEERLAITVQQRDRN